MNSVVNRTEVTVTSYNFTCALNRYAANKEIAATYLFNLGPLVFKGNQNKLVNSKKVSSNQEATTFLLSESENVLT